MRIKLTYIAPLLAAGAAAVAIAAAPTAAAAKCAELLGKISASRPAMFLFTAAVRSSARHRGGDGPTFGERMAGRRRCC